MIAKKIIELLIKAKGKPRPARYFFRYFQDTPLPAIQQSLSKLKKRGAIKYAKETSLHNKRIGGYYVEYKPNPVGRPKGPENPHCWGCNKEIKDWSFTKSGTQWPSICKTCQRIYSQVNYTRNRFRHGGIYAIQMEIIIRLIVETRPSASASEQLKAVLTELRLQKINPDLIPRENKR